MQTALHELHHRPPRDEAEFLARERLRAQGRFTMTIAHAGPCAAKAANPLRWIRRYPRASLGVLAGAGAAVAAYFVRRRSKDSRAACASAAPPPPSPWAPTVNAVTAELIRSLKQALIGALTTRLLWNAVEPSPEADAEPMTAGV